MRFVECFPAGSSEKVVHPWLRRINSPRLYYHQIYETWYRPTRTSVTSSDQPPKDLSHVFVETTTYRAGMQIVRIFTEC